MNFLQALTELKEGRCEGIKRNDYDFYIINDSLRLNNNSYFINNAVAFLANDWEIVNPKPTYTEIEKEYYMLVDKDGTTLATNSKPFNGKLPENISQVKLIGIFKQVVPHKVKKRIDITSVLVDFPDDAKLYAEWYEDEATK